MGLDWMLRDRVREGQEARVRELVEQMKKDPTLGIPQEVMDQVFVDPLEVLGAPRIGRDEHATEWLREQYRTNPEPFRRRTEDGSWEILPWEKVLVEEDGLYVLELAQHPEGLGAATGIAAPPYSFRGKVLLHLSILSDELKERAQEEMDPAQMLAYAQALEDAARAEAEQANSPEDRALMLQLLENGAVPDGPSLDPAFMEYHYVHVACRWLRFWAGHGFQMWAWY